MDSNLKVRSPRVQLSYDVERGEQIERMELPFVVGVLAELSGQSDLPRLNERRFMSISRDNLDSALRSIEPKLCFSVENKLSDDERLCVNLQFQKMRDFEPLEIIRRVDPLWQLFQRRSHLYCLVTDLDSNPTLHGWLIKLIRNPSDAIALGSQEWDVIFDQIITEAELGLGLDTEGELRAKENLNTFLAVAREASFRADADLVAQIETSIEKLDARLNEQLNQIMHAPEFQKLEASWRGLHYLVGKTNTSTNLTIRVLNVSKEELRKEFESAGDFHQSELFHKICNEAWRTPYGCLLGDYEFGRHPHDVLLLKRISQCAALAHAPFVAAAHPSLLDIESFENLDHLRHLDSVFNQNNYIQWRLFRDSDDSRYVGLVLPHMLMRLPYSSKKEVGYSFVENVNDGDHEKFLWGNAAYALGGCIVNAFAEHGWCAAIRGVDGGGLVDDLPQYMFCSVQGDELMKSPTEIDIFYRREAELANLGFISLIHRKRTAEAVFFSAPSCHKPITFGNTEATVNEQLWSQLPYVLVASRFAHYVKQIHLHFNKGGEKESNEELESFLNRWILNYVTLSADATPFDKARYPLAEARVEVGASPNDLNARLATIYLKPHFQLVIPPACFKMTLELPNPVPQ